MSNDFHKKIDELKRKYVSADDQKIISEIEKTLRRKVVESGLKDIEVIRDIMKSASQDVLEINRVLAYDTSLTDFERRVLFVKRDERIFWLERFGAWDADKIISEMESFVDSKIIEAKNLG